MADDNNARYRTTDPSSRGPEPAGPADDPLVELARLIGQSALGGPAGRRDTSFGSKAAPQLGNAIAPRAPAEAAVARPKYEAEPPLLPRGAPEPSPQRRAEPAPRTMPQPPLPGFSFDPEPRAEPELPRFRTEPRFGTEREAGFGTEREPRFGTERARHISDDPNDWPGSPPPSSRSDPFDPPAPSRSARPSSFPDPFELPPPPSMRESSRPDPFDLPAPPQSPPPKMLGGPLDDEEEERPLQRVFGPRPFLDPRPSKLGADFDREFGLQPQSDRHGLDLGNFPEPAEGDPSDQNDEFYDEPPRGDRRKGLMTVVAVFCLAVVGTAAAVGYRSVFGGPSSSAPPPVIRASGEPSKVAPPPAQTDQTASKFSYDRFGDRSSNEQVVAREEKPVDPGIQARANAPQPQRGVFPPPPPFPGAGGAAMAPSGTAVAPSAAPANAPSALGEPRRVRTMQIRPDQAEPSTTPQSIAAASAPNPAASGMPAQRMAARAPTTRQSQPPSDANAPLSLAPDSSSAPPPVPIINSASQPRAQGAPARVASAPTGGVGGGYVVQVSSQRSEADAESAYRNIHNKFTGVLNGQPHMVKRADLGNRGVYYRAMIGPYGSRDEAVQLCGNLKSAGGDCVVQAN